MRYFPPPILLALGLVVLLVGLAFRNKFRHQELFVFGIVLVALSFVTFWPVHIMWSEWLDESIRYGIVAFVPVLFSLFIFARGVGLIGQAAR